VPQQFSLAKSRPGFAPLGPALVTADEFTDPDDLAIGCRVDDEQMQQARTGDLIFTIADLVSYLSSVVTLFPGDIIFTGTPSGIGYARTPRRFLRAGEQLISHIEGIGELRQRMV
jgi:2-keto-4-pentenoate hydratase/2-oxohepta-3-ene-1,7-dioic acid hydratase in catechol pathway